MTKMYAWSTLPFYNSLIAFDNYDDFFSYTWIPVLFGPFQPIVRGTSLELITWRNNSVFVISPLEIISVEHD